MASLLASPLGGFVSGAHVVVEVYASQLIRSVSAASSRSRALTPSLTCVEMPSRKL